MVSLEDGEGFLFVGKRRKAPPTLGPKPKASKPVAVTPKPLDPLRGSSCLGSEPGQPRAQKEAPSIQAKMRPGIPPGSFCYWRIKGESRPKRFPDSALCFR